MQSRALKLWELTTTRSSTVAPGSRFALATLRFAAVLDASSPHDAILQLASELFAHDSINYEV